MATTPVLYYAEFYTPNFAGGTYGIFLEWDILVGETYEIQVSLDETFTSFQSTTLEGFDTGGVNPSAIGFDTIGDPFVADTTYYFRINATDGGGTTDWSNILSASTANAFDMGGGGGGGIAVGAYEFQPFQSSLNRLAGLDGSYSAQYAANVWAGTVDEPLLNALNIIAGTQGLGLRAVVNLIAGTDNLGVDEALRRIP